MSSKSARPINPVLAAVWRTDNTREYTLLGRDVVLLSSSRDRALTMSSNSELTKIGKDLIREVRGSKWLKDNHPTTLACAYGATLAIRFAQSCDGMGTNKVIELDELIAQYFIYHLGHLELSLITDEELTGVISGYRASPRPR